jgi:hypothetical protein
VASWGVFGSQKDTSRLGPDFPIDVCSSFVPTSTPENQKNIDFSLVFQAFLRKLPLEVNIEFKSKNLRKINPNSTKNLPKIALMGVLSALGGLLGASWARLGASWRPLGASLAHLGVLLAHLGASWARLGRVLEASSRVLARLGHLQASKIGKSLKNQRKTIKNHPNINPIAIAALKSHFLRSILLRASIWKPLGSRAPLASLAALARSLRSPHTGAASILQDLGSLLGSLGSVSEVS